MHTLIDVLYVSSRAVVKGKLILRVICCCSPGWIGMGENIAVVSVVDRFLEHPMVCIFKNGGDNKIYLSSADFMTRNIENRVEVACPVYDKELQQQILDTFNISWNDNTQGRIVNQNPQNKMIRAKKGDTQIRSQWMTYDYYKNKLIQ